MDSRYNTIFSGRNDGQSSSLANFGKASLIGNGNYAPSGAQTNNESDAAMKFFEGSVGSSTGSNFTNETGAALFTDDSGQALTNRKTQNYQDSQTTRMLDTGRLTASTNDYRSDNIDYDRLSIKPHNPFVNHSSSSQLWAIKAQISREMPNTHIPTDSYPLQPTPGQTSTYFDNNSYSAQSRLSSINNNPLAASARFSNPNLTGRQVNNFGSSPGLTARTQSIYSPDLEKLTILPEANPSADKLNKAKKFQNELEWKKELLIQVEERKKREEEAARKDRLDDAMQEEKIRQEIKEFERVYGVKYEGLEARNLNLSLASELERARALAKKKDLFSSLDRLKPAARKPSNKRPRTPIEEVERIMGLEKPSLKKVESPDQLLQKLPYAMKKQISELVEGGLAPFREEINDEQKKLSRHVSELEMHARLLEQQKIAKKQELEVLRLRLKQNQAIEEKKQAAVYTELIKNRKDPSYLHSTSTAIDPEIEEEIYSLSSKLKRKGYWNTLGKKREQDLDSEIRSSSHLFSLSHRGKVLNPEELEYGYLRPTENEVKAKYIGYYGEGRKNGLEGNYGVYDMIPTQLQDDEVMNDAVDLLRKNKERLKLLDEIEDPDMNKLGRVFDSLEFGYDKNERNPHEGLENLRNRYLGDYSDGLIEKINSAGGFYA